MLRGEKVVLRAIERADLPQYVHFTHEGRERDGYYQHGRYIDVLRMSILDYEWRVLSSFDGSKIEPQTTE